MLLSIIFLQCLLHLLPDGLMRSSVQLPVALARGKSMTGFILIRNRPVYPTHLVFLHYIEPFLILIRKPEDHDPKPPYQHILIQRPANRSSCGSLQFFIMQIIFMGGCIEMKGIHHILHTLDRALSRTISIYWSQCG